MRNNIDQYTAANPCSELSEWLAEEGVRLLAERSDWTRSLAQALRNAGPAPSPPPPPSPTLSPTLTLMGRAYPGQVCLLLVRSSTCPSDL